MSEEKVVITLRGIERVRVRYGRARLMVAREGDLNRDRLGRDLASYAAGEIDADELCGTFTMSRVRSHSPSFDWHTADRQRVLELVVGASQTPEFDGSDPVSVAETLVRAGTKEIEALQKMAGRIGANIGGVAKFNPAIYSNAFGGIGADCRKTLPAKAAAGTWESPLAGAQASLKKALEASSITAKLDFARSEAIKRLGVGIGSFAGSENEAAKLAARFSALGVAKARPVWAQGIAARLDWPKPAISMLESIRGSGLVDQINMAVKPILPHAAEMVRSWKEMFERALPLNWRELDGSELESMTELMAETGIGLAWAPRVELIRALLKAGDHEERCAVLVCNRDSILEDVEAVLCEVADPDLLAYRAACEESIATYRDDHPGPAQTYAATTLTALIHDYLDYDNFGPVKQIFTAQHPREVGISDFARFAVGRAWVRTHASFATAGEGFNRNLTVHKLGSFHSEANLLSGLMLLTGLLREFQRLAEIESRRELLAA